MMAIRIVLYGIVAFVVARRNRNKTGGATAGPLTALANRLLGQTGDAATGAPAARFSAAARPTRFSRAVERNCSVTWTSS